MVTDLRSDGLQIRCFRRWSISVLAIIEPPRGGSDPRAAFGDGLNLSALVGWPTSRLLMRLVLTEEFWVRRNAPDVRFRAIATPSQVPTANLPPRCRSSQAFAMPTSLIIVDDFLEHIDDSRADALQPA